MKSSTKITLEKIIFLVLLFLSAGLLCNEFIIRKLQENGWVTPGPLPSYKTVPGGKSAQEVILISDPKKGEFAVKLFNNLANYRAELKEIKTSESVFQKMEKLKEGFSRKLPIIAAPLGNLEINGFGLIILSKANGLELNQIIANISTYSDDAIKSMFFTIGEQLGNLRLLLDAKKKGYALIHPDLNLGNLMYDDNHKQLYWIDAANIELKLYPDQDLNYNTRHFAFIQVMAQAIFGPVASDGSHETYYISKLQNKETSAAEIELIASTIKKILIAIKSLYEGYSKAFNIRITDSGYFGLINAESIFQFSENFVNLTTIKSFIDDVVNPALVSRNLDAIKL